jgi:hypothetical protein
VSACTAAFDESPMCCEAAIGAASSVAMPARSRPAHAKRNMKRIEKQRCEDNSRTRPSRLALFAYCIAFIARSFYDLAIRRCKPGPVRWP